MREIKFRVWDAEKKIMEEVGAIDWAHGNNGLEVITVNTKTTKHYRMPDDWGEQPFSIMQYTGLKDKNGNEIYDGDIVWDEEWGYDQKTGKKDVGQFCWDEDGRWVLVGGKKSEYALGGYVYHPFKVIGNIHENPELLSDKAGEGV